MLHGCATFDRLFERKIIRQPTLLLTNILFSGLQTICLLVDVLWFQGTRCSSVYFLYG